MNIFYLDRDHDKAAEMLADKHVVKMIVESVQLMCTALFINGVKNTPVKPTHINHPCTKWVASSIENYAWLWNHLYTMTFEYTSRYGKVHKYSKLLNDLWTEDIKSLLPKAQFTDPPQCMPDVYKCDDTVTAYRNYYMHEKSKFAKWKLGNVPDWYQPKQSLIVQ